MAAPIPSPIVNSKILTPKPGAVFRAGETITVTYEVVTPAEDAAPTVDVLIQKEGNDFAYEIANGLSTANLKDGVLTLNIPLGLIENEEIAGIGEYKLITVQHNHSKLKIEPGPLPTRQLTGHQKYSVEPFLGVGPVKPPTSTAAASAT